ncbi:uncharacterized protein LOC132788581 [Drosophila nasuta]|uniref:uncharacterized protein LOC132788581 n=1 Tax=Drosophila nasuta TaxID=42062 RepID=UPI00295EF21D|nr:uncharacterized protein LOC132788581 [Drosophila nasuta]XP_060652049.1 uncharacterized protein LOC132788581 [Drosophila nasuta]
MAQVKCNEPGDWRDAPFLVVLYDYTMKNAEFPSDIGTLIAYVLVLIVSWYVVLWTARFLLSLVWPVIIVVSAFLLFRFLHTFQHEDLGDIVLHTLTYVVDTAAYIIEKIFEFLASVVQ